MKLATKALGRTAGLLRTRGGKSMQGGQRRQNSAGPLPRPWPNEGTRARGHGGSGQWAVDSDGTAEHGAQAEGRGQPAQRVPCGSGGPGTQAHSGSGLWRPMSPAGLCHSPQPCRHSRRAAIGPGTGRGCWGGRRGTSPSHQGLGRWRVTGREGWPEGKGQRTRGWVTQWEARPRAGADAVRGG